MTERNQTRQRSRKATDSVVRAPMHGPPGSDPYEPDPDGPADEPASADPPGVPTHGPPGSDPYGKIPFVPTNGPPSGDQHWTAR